MLATIKIKEEPLDEIEDLQEVFKQQEALMKQQINDEILKQTLAPNNFHIVEEQDSIITVSAADMRAEDELQFIDSINNTDPLKFKGVCSKCLKTFTNRAQFLKHTKRNHCITKQKCPVCPVTFIDSASLLNHLNLHRENYFFCYYHCGANFQTLPLCEEHELKEHKTQSSRKISFRHFCSFCRKGFKTELQLHVHWLQQTQGCGKLMQDVVLCSNNVVNYISANNNSTKTYNLEKPKQPFTANPVSTVPITKLRLKSSISPIALNEINKTHEKNDGETGMKRKKQSDLNFDTDIKIKEEPLDEDESNMTSNLIPEVIIKTEEEDETEKNPSNKKPKITSLLINNMISSGFSGKFIPIEEFASTETPKTDNGKQEMKTFSLNKITNLNVHDIANDNLNCNNISVLKLINNNSNTVNTNSFNTNNKTDTNFKLVKIGPSSIASSNKIANNLTFTNLKNCSTGKLMTLKLANTQNINTNNGDIKPLPKSGLQIIKFLPNTQVMTLKSLNGTILNNNSTGNKQPVVIKLTTPPTIVKQTESVTNPPPLVPTTAIPNACNTSAVTIKLNSIDRNTTIDAEDFKKLQAEALIKVEEHRKNFYIHKDRLKLIENMPEKKQIIDSMKQQIAEVETKSEKSQSKTENFILNTKKPNDPPTLYLPILSKIDVSLAQARYQNPNYVYKWICPYCLKEYEIKRALKIHLSKAHYLNNRDMEKINVQAKPFKNEAEDKVTPIKEELQDSDSQPLKSGLESLHAENNSSLSPKTSSNPIKMTHLKCQRSRYVCEKCGRTYSSKTMLNDHIFANCSREPQYACKECHKKFYSHGTLQCHMTIHTGELPHKCNYCDKRFRTRGQVKVHHRTHTGEKPFFCQVCSQRFTHRETLISHLSRHIGMKRYKCYGCDKHFSCISALKTHRDIRADTCGKVKFNPRAIGPRVRVIRGNVIFEPQPEINPYLKSEDPKTVLSELQNQAPSK